MIIDSFTHMAHKAYLEELRGGGRAMSTTSADDIYKLAAALPQATDPRRRVEFLDEYGIDRQVVTLYHSLDCNVITRDPAYKLTLAKLINDTMARIVDESRGRLVATGGVPLDVLEAGGLKEMDRAVKSLGLKAMALPSHVHGKPLDLPEYRPFWSRAAEMGVPVYIHPANPVEVGRAYEGDYRLTHVYGWPYETTLSLTRLVISGIMEAYPGLKVVSHHLGGGMIPFLWGRVEESYLGEAQRHFREHALPKPVYEYFRRFYYDTAVGNNGAAIKYACQLFGAGQVVLATDFPHGLNGGADRLRDYPKIIKALDIPEEDRQSILGGNARKMLNL
ncbi:MAG: amidohydrolase [Chloroflexi bacterium]|nr:amidohydrolase [Chloroflexota bacterium]